MLTLSMTLDLRAPVHRVWSVLLDFPKYREWHPFFKLAGAGAEGAVLDFTFRRHPNAPGGLTAKATIVRLQPEEVFAFRYGVRGVLLAEDRFELLPINGRTRLTRTTDYGGFVPFVSGWAAKKRMTSLLEMPVHSLARYLAGPNLPSAAKAAQIGQPRRRRRRRP